MEVVTENNSGTNRKELPHEIEDCGEEEIRLGEHPIVKGCSIREQMNLPKRPNIIEQPARTMIKAKDAIRMVETLRGRDDVGVEDFIKSAEYARSVCSEEQLLLKLIVVEKVIENAKRSIRYINIESYGELNVHLRNYVSISTTVVACTNRLNQTKHGQTESVQSYNLRFRQTLNGLIYAVQNKYFEPVRRRIVIEEEEDEAVRTYVLN